MIITLTGKNSFLLHKKYLEIVNDFVTANSDLAVEKLDGQEADTPHMVEAIESLPFLSTSKLVILHSPSTQKDFAEAFAKIASRVPETTQLVIVEPQLDKRSVYAKELKKLTDYNDFEHLDGNNLANWLVDEAKKQEASISLVDARYLVGRVGGGQELLFNELQKLVTYSPQVTRDSIDLLTEETPQSTIFQLLESAFGGNIKQALSLYEDQRKQKVEPQAILAMIAWQLHIMALVATAGERSDSEIAKEAGVSPFVAQKSRNIVRRIGGKRVKLLVAEALNLDIRLKSEAIDADDALQNYIVNLSV